MYRYSLLLIGLTLCSCWAPCIDEKYAATIAKEKLLLSDNVFAQKLSGGFGSTINFLVTDGSKKYVVRINEDKTQENRNAEVHNLKVAADNGFGQQMYFADTLQGIVIVEYLSGKIISDEEIGYYLAEQTPPNQDLQSNQFYVALAHLLQKIHRGDAFEGYKDYVFNSIRVGLREAKSTYGDYIPLTKIELVITVIRQALLSHLTNTTPCHNDLHRGNLIFLGNEFKAIDYENASQGDPFFDVATVSATFYCKPEHENVLLRTYLGRQPSEIEKAKFYLMKQAIWIKWFLDDLKRCAPETVHQYGSVKTLSLINLAKELIAGKIDVSKPENKLKILKAQLEHIVENSESQEFKRAVSLLTEETKQS